jgi:predicted XRE-type DNA-binding protein
MKNKISTIEELVHLAEIGERVSSPCVTWLATPKKAEALMGMSCRSLLTMIRKGIYTKMDVPSSDKQIAQLEEIKAKVRATGMSYSEIANKLGVTKQAVGQFMKASDVKSSTIKRYEEMVCTR